MSRHCMQYVIQTVELCYFYFFDVQLIIFCLLFHSAGCGDPTPPVNGSIVEFVSAVVGSQILYSCDPGFHPEGLRTSICSSNMNWSSNPADFTCRKLCKLYMTLRCKCLKYRGVTAQMCSDKYCNWAVINTGLTFDPVLQCKL